MHIYSFEKLETWQKSQNVQKRHLQFDQEIS
jgi:hypothetical protein